MHLIQYSPADTAPHQVLRYKVSWSSNKLSSLVEAYTTFQLGLNHRISYFRPMTDVSQLQSPSLIFI